jgi:hypothetical protein
MYQVTVSREVIDALSGIAVDFGVDSIETIIDGILREKIFALRGVEIPSINKIRKKELRERNLAEESDFLSGLRSAVSNDGRNTFKEELGPKLDQAPEQYASQTDKEELNKIIRDLSDSPFGTRQE